jgi:iron complex outermembrane receptor protein
VQNAWSVSEKFTVESGLRGDYVNDFGFELMPRVSAMVRVTPKLTTRIGGGFGYKTPTIFTEEAERAQFQNILPINRATLENEESVGGNWDINYSTKIGAVGFSINHLFYYTRLNQPLVMVPATGGKMEFINADGYIDTKGVETNLRFIYSGFKLFIGYTLTDAHTNFLNSKAVLPLTARHRLNNVLMYEVEDKIKIGLEAYYYSRQKLNDGTFGKQYWLAGLMAEKLWEKFSVYINFENFTNTRQSRFDVIYTGSINNPVFRDIYAPVEGFVINGGIKLRL